MSASGDDIIDLLTGNGDDTVDNTDELDIEDTWLEGLKSVRGTLITFGQNPVGFVLGAILSTFLAGVQTVVESLIDAIILLFLGSDGEPSATGTLGLADLPVAAVSILGGSAGAVVGEIASGIRSVNRAAVEVATIAGPASPVVYAALLAAALIASAWALRTAIAVIADAIPGVQGLI